MITIILIIVWLLIGAGGVFIINAKYLESEHVEPAELILSIFGILLWIVFVWLMIDKKLGEIKNPFYKPKPKVK